MVTLHATPSQVALVVAAPMASAPVGRLAASGWAERSPGRVGPLLATDIARLLSVASIPTTFFLAVLSLPVLVAQAAVLGALVGTFGAFGAPFVVRIVEAEDLQRANGALASSSNAAAVLGPAIGAGLLELVSPPVALVAELAAYAVAIPKLVRLGRRRGSVMPGPPHPEAPAPAMSGGSAPGVPAPAPPGEPGSPAPALERPDASLRPSHGSRRRAALLAPFVHPATRGRLAVLFAAAVLNGTVLAVLSVFMVRDLHLPASLVAGVGAVGALGGVAAGLAIGQLTRALGERRSLALALVAMAASAVPLPLATEGLLGLWPCLVYELFGAAGGTVFVVLTFTAIQQRMPGDQLARAMAAAALVPEAGQLLGVAAAGVAVAALGVRDLLWVAAALGLVVSAAGLVDATRATLTRPGHAR